MNKNWYIEPDPDLEDNDPDAESSTDDPTICW